MPGCFPSWVVLAPHFLRAATARSSSAWTSPARTSRETITQVNDHLRREFMSACLIAGFYPGDGTPTREWAMPAYSTRLQATTGRAASLANSDLGRRPRLTWFGPIHRSAQ